MSKRLVTILWGIVGLLAAFTLIVKSSQNDNNSAPTEREQGEVIFKNLPLAKIASMKIEGASETVTITKEEDQWSLQERNGYEIDFPKLTRFLRSLTEAAIAQSRKAGPAFDNRFGMDSKSDIQEEHGYKLTFQDAQGENIQTLTIGKSIAAQGARVTGKYLRLGNEKDAVYAVNENFPDLTTKVTDWLSKEFIAIDGIQSIQLETPKGDIINGWSVARNTEDSEFAILELTANREPQSDKLSALKNILSAPQFEDVLTEEEAKEKRDEEKVRKITISTFDGLVYNLEYAPLKSKSSELEEGVSISSGFVMKVDVSANLPSERTAAEDETEEEAKAAEAEFLAKQEEVKKKLAREQPYSSYYYLVADYTLSALNIGKDALAKPVAKSDLVAPTIATPRPSPLAPAAPVVTTPPVVIPPAPAAQQVVEAEEAPPATHNAEDSENSDQSEEPNNSDALNVLSEEDIERIMKDTLESEIQEAAPDSEENPG